jgi:endonuclease/exonuclease/phosphatase family metal-dependent hydrolase
VFARSLKFKHQTRQEDTMILASYNVENLFDRARVLNLDTWQQGKPILEKHAAFNALLNKTRYTAADKTRILRFIVEFGLEKEDTGEFVILRQNRGKLLKRGKAGLEVVAEGRGDWIGWLELRKTTVDERATRNTGQVIRDVNADVLAVIEAEDRIALERFSEAVLLGVGGQPYRHVMVIDGNDERGIDVGLLTRDGYPITMIRSHIDDEDAQGEIFSRDCPEYHIRTPSGQDLWVLVNHFKSKGFGSQTTSNQKRIRQARRVRALYEALLEQGAQYVAVVGDLNDTPDSAPLQPLLNGSGLRDASKLAEFDDGGRPGTFGNGTASGKLDYVLLSPDLFDRAVRGGIFRKGVWGGKNGTLWEIYPEMERASHAASDHAAIWVELNL